MRLVERVDLKPGRCDEIVPAALSSILFSSRHIEIIHESF